MVKKGAFQSSDAAYTKAFNAGDPAAIAEMYTKDALVLMPETPLYKGRKGVKAQVQAGLDAGWRNIKFKAIKSGSDGDLAFNIGTVSVDAVAGGKKSKVKGKYLDVYRRGSDGSWKIIATMFNPDKAAV